MKLCSPVTVHSMVCVCKETFITYLDHKRTGHFSVSLGFNHYHALLYIMLPSLVTSIFTAP
jgi:hypothetical protein